MAGFNIEQATVGYDTQGLQDAVNKMNLQIFTDVIVYLRSRVVPLNLAVDSMWAGQAANAFKNKFEKDVEVMAETLEQLKEQVFNEMSTIAANVDTYDSNVAEIINNME